MTLVDAVDAPLSVTVAPLPFAAGLMLPEIVQVWFWTMLTVEPMAELVSALPFPEQATLLPTATADEVFVVELAMVRTTVATLPFEIVVELDPRSTHLTVPTPGLQVSDLFAALPAEPTAIVAPEKSDAA